MNENPTPPSTGDTHSGGSSLLTTIVVLAIFAVVVRMLQWILLPFVIAGLLAFVLTPAVDWLAARLRAPRTLIAVVIFLILLIIGAAVGFVGVPPLIREVSQVIGDLQHTIATLLKGVAGHGQLSWLGKQASPDELAQSAVVSIRKWVGQPERIVLLGGAAFGSIFSVFLTLLLLLYLLLGGGRVVRRLLFIVPPARRSRVEEIRQRADPVLRRYFIGVIAVVVYASVAAYIGLGVALGIPHAAFLAMLTGVLEVIPVIGPAASAIIAGIVAIHYAKAIGAIIAYAIYATALRLSIDQLFGPLVLGAAARLHPVLIIFCFLSGGLLFGIVGVIMAVPIALIIKTTLAVVYGDTGRGSTAKGENQSGAVSRS